MEENVYVTTRANANLATPGPTVRSLFADEDVKMEENVLQKINVYAQTATVADDVRKLFADLNVNTGPVFSLMFVNAEKAITDLNATNLNVRDHARMEAHV